MASGAAVKSALTFFGALLIVAGLALAARTAWAYVPANVAFSETANDPDSGFLLPIRMISNQAEATWYLLCGVIFCTGCVLLAARCLVEAIEARG